MRFTSNRLANLQSKAFGLEKAATVRMQRAFANMIHQAIVPTTPDPHDERGTRIMTDEAAALALLFLPLADMSVDARGLRDFAARLSDIERDGITHIRNALTAVRAGEAVELVVNMRWDGTEATVMRSAYFQYPDRPVDPEVLPFRSDASLARMTVPASRILKHLVAALED